MSEVIATVSVRDFPVFVRLVKEHEQLLAACKAARELFDKGCVDRGYSDQRNWIDAALDEIDAAIQAAEGEQM